MSGAVAEVLCFAGQTDYPDPGEQTDDLEAEVDRQQLSGRLGWEMLPPTFTPWR